MHEEEEEEDHADEDANDQVEEEQEDDQESEGKILTGQLLLLSTKDFWIGFLNSATISMANRILTWNYAPNTHRFPNFKISLISRSKFK